MLETPAAGGHAVADPKPAGRYRFPDPKRSTPSLESAIGPRLSYAGLCAFSLLRLYRIQRCGSPNALELRAQTRYTVDSPPLIQIARLVNDANASPSAENEID